MTQLQKTITIEEVQAALPSKKSTITQEAIDIINMSMNEPEFQGESLIQSMVTYESVLNGTKAGIRDYLNAIRFVAYMVSMDDNYTEAYKRTFYDRDFVKERLDAPTESNKYKELTSAASRYRKSKLVVDILTLSQVPLDLMFTGARYKALAILLDRAENSKMDRDKINAADKLLVHTASNSVSVDLKVGPNRAAMDMQETLNAQLAALAMNQKKLLESGMSIQEVQKTGINLNVIEGEYEEA